MQEWTKSLTDQTFKENIEQQKKYGLQSLAYSLSCGFVRTALEFAFTPAKW